MNTPKGGYINSLEYLMEQASVYFKERGEQVFKEIGLEITFEQALVMDTIASNPGICQMDLARLMLKDRSYTSRILDALEKKGFIERKLSKKNKRLVNELFTTQAVEKFSKEHGEKVCNLFSGIYKDISKEEFEMVRKIVTKMKNCVSEFTVIPL